MPPRWPQELDLLEQRASVLGRVLGVLRRHFVAALALFLVLGGSAYAAVTVGRESVGSLEISNRSVDTEDLARGAVTTLKIAPNAVTPSRIAPGAVNSDDVEDGSLTLEDFKRGQVPQGPAGERGPAGPAGRQGPSGTTPAPETPKTVTSFLNGWAAYDEDFDGVADVPVRYWKDLSGVVHLEGAAERASMPADPSDIFVLPPGYRPAAEYVSLPTITTSHGRGNFDEQLGYVWIGRDGTVLYGGGKSGYFAFDGVSFRAGTE